ncbi:PLP-dependent aminotransferase family protein [Staphylococcus schweitzeri]|uniref:PLP-dependent aminotransferase family protein n=1 Tax=Staphylococcus schweitzeri TaxID=1654388 RepID=A0A2K4AEL3_9STAP|nr:PLP-dependent aminotransferase family protein [Staphylococcus schweitzeri]MBE2129617.1 PLP-dependent aminotransferase family protein [Staphylococcus schweitzeri]PNZ48540.1 PLP-dependent aminotransferase family protein [Staphylococcus schweitzeri]CDR29410.1 transcriptional regulator of pyridoxine metabolism [Staphylococcus schweitzeri]CDR51371.1 transcriptional regulator of pyridoxine metabolism [Staphylococcus schweitzeri]CDR54137.1 transcriptional regulator of pyridoxine metabolism [Staphy
MKNTLYHQLYEKLKKQIIEGQFKKDDKFYSKRQLSKHLSISQTTVEHAYQLLLDEGYIYSKPRSGYYVSEIESLSILHTHATPVLDDILTPQRDNETYQFAFNLDEIDTKHFPIDLFRKYSKELYDQDYLNMLLRGHNQGEFQLRFQLAHYLFNNRGVICNPDQIIIGSSTEQLVNLLVDLLSSSTFIIEKPSYPPIKHILDKKNVTYDQIKVEHNGINVDEVIKSKKNLVYITPSHQFPTGYVMDLKKRIQLIQWAKEKEERYIIEDDYDSEFRYFGKPIPSIQGLYSRDKVIYISTFSKSIFPSCRVAYMVLPTTLLEKYHLQNHIEGNTVPVHIQNLIAKFMSTGSFERHLNKMRRIYRRKIAYIIQRLKPYENQIDIQGAETGMHFTITVLNGLSLQECINRAKSMNLKLQAYDFDDDLKQNRSPKFILGFGGIDDDDLKSHVDVLIKSLII